MADDKRTHLLNRIPYEEVPREAIELPDRDMDGAFDDRATLSSRRFVPERF